MRKYVENPGRTHKTKNGLIKPVVFLVTFLVAFSGYAIAQKERDSLLKLPLFKSEDLLRIELKTNLNLLINDVGDDPKYHAGQMSLMVGAETDVKHFEVEVKTRGNFRRRKQNCNFPPLRFRFPLEEVKETAFRGQETLKYVSHCQTHVDDFEQHTIEEYLIYKMYNLISDYSYRVRLAQVSFIDTISSDTIRKFGFFLEDRDDVAMRFGRRILNYKNLKQYNMLRENMVMLSIFQVMIGNSDWDLERLHNIDVVSVDENSIPVAIPYDFDWSEMISQAYFTPNPNIDPNSKYKRHYKGYRWSTEEFEVAFSKFQELKELFTELVLSCDYLHKENQQKLLSYILEFYELLGSRKDIKTVFVKNAPRIPIQ